MLSIDSKLWSVRAYSDAYAHITQRASGVCRTVSRGKLPDQNALAMMHERRFDAVCRGLFHGDDIAPRKGIYSA